ncbi:MAG: ABC transporter substrate-binding protein [Clostridiales bacterium]|nr:ABC transporter substrate-binding protein [Clostridiales bacterium]
MRKLLSLLLVLALAFSLVACAGGTAPAATEAPAADAAATEAPAEATGEGITLGVISPNTGALAVYGAAVTTAVDLAVSEINASGGILGQQVTVINTDDQFDPAETLNAFNSLVSQGVGLIVGSVTSGCTSAITSAANEEGVVLLTPSATADSITTANDYVFRACYADSFQGAIAAYYAKEAGYADVGVVYCAADTYSKGLYDSFAAAAATYGLNIKAVESTASLDVQDYTNQFASMASSGVQFVYAPYYYDVIGPYIVTQARAAGYTGIIMGADGYDGTPDYVVEGADLTAFNNVYWTNHYDPTDTDPMVQSFVAAYQAMFNSTPNAISALAYDAVYMYKLAIEKAGSADPAAVRDALADPSTTFSGVTGTFAFNSETGTPSKGAVILSFASDGTSVTTKLVDVIKELK